MTGPLRTQALGQLTPEDLVAMLAENETLFVEHKGNLRPEGDAYNVAKAISAFANTLGGWVLIGVTNSTPNAGKEGGWEPVAPYELVDRVRQVLERHVEPIPPFAATVMGEGTDQVGVVRVYESADTPHITRPDGAIYVRSVAQDRKYQSLPLESQTTLFALAQRGERAAGEAEKLLAPARTPLMENALSLQHMGGGPYYMQGAGVVLRAVPLTHHRMTEWAVTKDARDVLFDVVTRLARTATDRKPEFQPLASGLIVRHRSDAEEPFRDDLEPPRMWHVVTATDVAGVIGAGIRPGNPSPPLPKTVVSLDDLRDGLFVPLLEAVVAVMLKGEFFGRVHFEFQIAGLDQVFDLRHEEVALTMPSYFPTGGELSLPGAVFAAEGEATELVQLADQCVGDFAREAGYPLLR